MSNSSSTEHESAVPSEPTARTVVEDATCVACGCLGDDLTLVAEGGRIVEARHACEVGRR